MDQPISWADREAYWRRKLRRLQFEAEPIEQQVERHRRSTVALTAVSAGVGLLFLAIFGAFGRPDVGGVVAGVLLAPPSALAWLDFAVLQARASAYLGERAVHFSREDAPPS